MYYISTFSFFLTQRRCSDRSLYSENMKLPTPYTHYSSLSHFYCMVGVGINFYPPSNWFVCCFRLRRMHVCKYSILYTMHPQDMILDLSSANRQVVLIQSKFSDIFHLKRKLGFKFLILYITDKATWVSSIYKKGLVYI